MFQTSCRKEEWGLTVPPEEAADRLATNGTQNAIGTATSCIDEPELEVLLPLPGQLECPISTKFNP